MSAQAGCCCRPACPAGRWSRCRSPNGLRGRPSSSTGKGRSQAMDTRPPLCFPGCQSGPRVCPHALPCLPYPAQPSPAGEAGSPEIERHAHAGPCTHPAAHTLTTPTKPRPLLHAGCTCPPPTVWSWCGSCRSRCSRGAACSSWDPTAAARAACSGAPSAAAAAGCRVPAPSGCRPTLPAPPARRVPALPALRFGLVCCYHGGPSLPQPGPRPPDLHPAPNQPPTRASTHAGWPRACGRCRRAR